MDLINDSQHYTPPNEQECECCSETWDEFMELEVCDDCGQDCCLRCSIEWFDKTVCFECIEELYLMTGKEVVE